MTTETPWGLALQRLEHATADSKAINCFGTSAAQSALLHLRHWAKHVKQSGRWATSGHKRQEGNGTKQMQMPSMKPWLQAAPIQISTDAPMRDRKTFETWADFFFNFTFFLCSYWRCEILNCHVYHFFFTLWGLPLIMMWRPMNLDAQRNTTYSYIFNSFRSPTVTKRLSTISHCMWMPEFESICLHL